MKPLTKPHALALLDRPDGIPRPADYLTVANWADMLQVSKRTIFRMIDEGIIPPYDFATGKTRRWNIRTYRRWAAERGGGE